MHRNQSIYHILICDRIRCKQIILLAHRQIFIKKSFVIIKKFNFYMIYLKKIISF